MRNAKIDNYKGLLILLVVIGHTINAFGITTPWVRQLNLCIYFFHMPAFFFLSGYFHKTPEKCPWRKTAFFLMLGLSLRAIILCIQIFFGKNPDLSLLDGSGVYWFAFVMAYYQIAAWFFRKTDAKKVIFASIFLAVLCGYFPKIGTYLHLSRAIVFFPFFYIGVCYGKKIDAYISTKKYFSIFVFCILFAITRLPYGAVRMFTGRNSYGAMGLSWEGGILRLLWMVFSFLFLTSLFSIIPKKEIKPLTFFGRRTLPIYFWHRIFLTIFAYAGFTTDHFLLLAIALSAATAYFPVPFAFLRGAAPHPARGPLRGAEHAP